MKLLLLLGLGIIFSSETNAQEFLWAKRWGGQGGDYGFSVSAGPTGEVFLAGKFERKMTVDQFQLRADSIEDGFIIKVDSAGNVQWAQKMGGLQGGQIYSSATDKEGNLFVRGYFHAPGMVFGADTIKVQSFLSADIFVAKYSTSGKPLWLRTIADGIYSVITTDQQGNVYVVSDRYSLDPQVDMHKCVLLKYSNDGDLLYENVFSSGFTFGWGIAVDAQQQPIISGIISDTVTFGATTFIEPVGSGFIAGFNRDGTMKWSTRPMVISPGLWKRIGCRWARKFLFVRNPIGDYLINKV